MKKKVAQLEIETDLTNEQVLIACMALKSDDPPFEVGRECGPDAAITGVVVRSIFPGFCAGLPVRWNNIEAP